MIGLIANVASQIGTMLADITMTGISTAGTIDYMNAETVDDVINSSKTDETSQYAAEVQDEYVNGPKENNKNQGGMFPPISSSSSSSVSIISSISCLVLVMAFI